MQVAPAPVRRAADVRGCGVIGADLSQLNHDLVELRGTRRARTSMLRAVPRGDGPRHLAGPGTARASAPGRAVEPESRRRRSGTITQP
jgi:hypothetical protein